MDDCSVTLHARPYFLRLTLPLPVQDLPEEQIKSTYDAETGELRFAIPKKEKVPFVGLSLVVDAVTQKLDEKRSKMRNTGIQDVSNNLDDRWDEIEQGMIPEFLCLCYFIAPVAEASNWTLPLDFPTELLCNKVNNLYLFMRMVGKYWIWFQ